MNTTQLDTLKTLFGNDLAALLAFLDEIRFNGSYALWRLGSSGLTLQDVEAALNATAWRTSASPKALLPAAGVRHYLVVNTSYAGADGSSGSAATLCMTRAQWQALSSAHAGQANYAWLSSMRNTDAGNPYSEVVALTGAKADIEGYIATMTAGQVASAGNFVQVDAKDTVRFANGVFSLPSDLPMAELDLVGRLQVGAGTAGPASGSEAMELQKTTVDAIREAVFAEAAKKLSEQGELAWTLYSALKNAPASATTVQLDISSDRLIAVLTAIDPQLAKRMTAGQSHIDVDRETLAAMAFDLRKDLPVALSALFEAQLASAPTASGLDAVDLSSWLGPMLFNGAGAETGLFQILKQEGFDPARKYVVPTLRKRASA